MQEPLKDAVTCYLKSISKNPMISSREQELDLSYKIQAMVTAFGSPSEQFPRLPENPTEAEFKILENGKEAFKFFVEANLRLVVAIAKKYKDNDLDFLSIIQFGNIGLMRAVEKFDPDKGYKFSTYAYWWVKQGIARGITNTGRMIRLPIHISDRLDRIKRVKRNLTQELQRKPSLIELEEALEMPSELIQDTLDFERNFRSLNYPLNSEDGNELGDILPSSTELDAYSTRNTLSMAVSKVLDELSEFDRKVVEMHMGLSQDKELNFKQISTKLKCSEETAMRSWVRSMVYIRKNHKELLELLDV